VQVHRVRDRHDLPGGHRDEFGVSAARQQSTDRLPDGPSGDAVTDDQVDPE